MYAIAQQKKKENISEYLLFLWQMEDLLRGINFDPQRLEDEVLSAIKSEEERRRTEKWLMEMAAMMKKEGLEVSGHHYETYEVLNELAMLQNTLISILKNAPFIKAYDAAKPVLGEFREKGEKIPKSDIETALTALYGLLTLRLARKEVSPETQEAMEPITNYVRELTKAYHLMKEGRLS